MPESGTKHGRSNREFGYCPVCGEKADDVTELPERIEDGEKEDVPGVHYDHTAQNTPGGGSCIEWADGETEQN
jgi:hypothetical protein